MTQMMSPEEARLYIIEAPQELYEGKYGKGILRSYPKATKALNILLSLFLTRLMMEEGMGEAVRFDTKCLRDALGSSGKATRVLRYALQERIIYATSGFDRIRHKCRRYALSTHLRDLNGFTANGECITCAVPAPAHYSIDYLAAEAELNRLQAEYPEEWTPIKTWHARNRLYGQHYESKGSTGRVYHKPNGMNKELRPFLRIGGETTAEVDIKNAQPLFLACLLLAAKTEGAGVARYVATVERGRLYESFAEWLTRKGCIQRAIKITKVGPSKKEPERAAAKQLVFWAIFGMSEYLPHIRWVWQWLREEFPGVAEWIQSNSTGKEWLARELQKLESSIVVPIAKKFGALSIHDGIRCRQSDVAAVESALSDAIEKKGVRATLTIEQ